MGVSLRYIIMILFSLFLVLQPCSAATISVQIAEQGVSEDYPAVEASSAWEAGLLDSIFDAGHIASNGPLIRLGKSANIKDISIPNNEIDEARIGAADYIIYVLLEYASPKKDDPTAKKIRLSPLRSTVLLAQVSPFKVLYRRVYNSLEPSTAGTEDQKTAQMVARDTIAHLKDR